MNKTTTETDIHAALTQLRSLFPTSSLEVTFGENKRGERYVSINTPCMERWTTHVTEVSLEEAMEAKRRDAARKDAVR